MDFKHQSIFLVQKASAGYLQFKLSEHEQRLLRVLLAPENEVFNCWQELWDNVEDYELLDFSCKELMPAAVRKVQLCLPQQVWQSACNGNAGFLIGLPRYVWTKNQYVISQTKVILKQFLQNGIPAISIKGISEILSNADMAFMRTTRDIDLLIKKVDFNKCAAFLKQTGWVKKPSGPDKEFINTLIERHAYTYKKADVVIELDLHLAAIGGMYNNTDSFTKHLMDNAIVLNSAEGLIVPSPEDRLLITTANIHVIDNWLAGHYCKYIFDAACILNTMDQGQIDKCIDDGSRLLGLGDKIEHTIGIIGDIKASFNKDKTLSFEDVKSNAVFFAVSDGLLNTAKNLKSTLVLFKIWISGRNMLKIPLYLFLKFLIFLFVNPVIKIKKRFSEPHPVDIVKAKKINRTRWYLSKPN